MDLATILKETGLPEAPLGTKAADTLATGWTLRESARGGCVAWQGEPDTQEHLVLSGRVISHIGDPEGRNICVGFHQGPIVLTPNLARTKSGISMVTIEVVSDVVVASMPADGLLDQMLTSEEIREWANAILRAEIGLKAEREWCLSALKGADRLNWFRGRFPDHEGIFGHTHIASFLGMTPVTLSRLRKGG